MTTISSSYCPVKLNKTYRIGLAVLAASVLMVLGSNEYHSASAQPQDGEAAPALSNGEQEEEETRGEMVHSNERGYTVTLNDVTWRNRFKWAAQVIVAPERLDELVPIYMYALDDACGPKTTCTLTALDIPANPDLHVGVAISEDMDNREIWKARPLSIRDFESLIQSASSNGSNSPYIVLSRPFVRARAEGNFWVSERDWQDGLERSQSLPLGTSQ